MEEINSFSTVVKLNAEEGSVKRKHLPTASHIGYLFGNREDGTLPDDSLVEAQESRFFTKKNKKDLAHTRRT